MCVAKVIYALLMAAAAAVRVAISTAVSASGFAPHSEARLCARTAPGGHGWSRALRFRPCGLVARANIAGILEVLDSGLAEAWSCSYFAHVSCLCVAALRAPLPTKRMAGCFVRAPGFVSGLG